MEVRALASLRPSDSIAEFRVNTNDFDAQQGHTAGANVNLALKSGGNAFHGAASYFNRIEQPLVDSIFCQSARDNPPDRAATTDAARCCRGRSSRTRPSSWCRAST